MANLNWLKKVRVNVPHRSGFDKSHRNLLTTQCGTLTPLLCDEVIPNTRVHLKLALQACLPPLATDAFMNVKLKTEAFFVPTRLLYGGYENWLTGQSANGDSVSIPVAKFTKEDFGTYLTPGSLADYLGLKFDRTPFLDDSAVLECNVFPFLAYHRIYDDWYRNTRIQQPIFVRPAAGYMMDLKYMPYAITNSIYPITSVEEFVDGKHLFELRQRNFGSDYFTEATASAWAHAGASSEKVSTTGSQFTIAALRAANSIQQWLERQSLAGLRLQDYVRSQYGASLSDGVAQRSLFLGSQDFDVYTKGVELNANNSTSSSPSGSNPFKIAGARYGNAYATGDGILIEDFVANEPGYIFVMASLVPKVVYSTGIERQMLRYTVSASQSDLATPILQNVGPQPIFAKELYGRFAFSDSSYFGQIHGYIDRYADFMTKEDQLHGILRDASSLEAFALQRSFSANYGINSAFLEIPTDYLDQVAAVAGQISAFGCWIDSYLDYKISQPLAQFCQPSLQDPAYEHGKEIEIRRNGSRL